LVSYSRLCNRPSTKTWRRFLRYSLHVKASFPMTTIRCHLIWNDQSTLRFS
jgi:hypothetical protein